MRTFHINQHWQNITTLLTIIILLIINAQKSNAQINPLGSIYYQNQYLANPAMAGLDEGLKLNFNYRKQWLSTPGAPQTQSFTGDYGFGNRVGLGVNVYNDKAGLIQRTSAMATYAYHLPIGSSDERLNFGVSLGVKNQHINENEVVGDPGDENINVINRRENYVDADFGTAYTSGSLTIQGAIPNLKSYFKKDYSDNTIDHSLFFTAVSYKFYFKEAGTVVEPKVVYRGIKGYSNILDIGSNVSIIDNALNFMAIYHSSQSATFGLGFNYRKTFTFTGMYTTETGQVSKYYNDGLEIGVSVNFK